MNWNVRIAGFRLVVLCGALGAALITKAGPIESLQPGQWVEIPNSHLEAVLPSPLPAGDPVWIIGAWSGGAYDTQRNRLLVWGGGHNDYCGNEVYAFDVPTLAWRRLTDPGGNPVSVHSYDGLEYLPKQDSFFAAGGSTCSPGGTSTSGTWLFHLANNSWEQKQSMPGSYGEFYDLSMVSDYDPVTGRVIMVGQHTSGDFDPAANRWTVHNNNIPGLDLGQTGAMDPELRKFIQIGNGAAYIFDVDSSSRLGARSNLNSSGDKSIENTTSPGLVYDPVSKRIVAWASGSDVYTLDVATRTWTRHTATNSVSPGDPKVNDDYRGTFGRFRYMPDYNAFIVVTAIYRNVFAYKLTAGTGVQNPSVSLSAAPTSVASGQTSVLTWTASNADACTASGGWSGPRAMSGSETTAAMTATKTYTLTCTSSGGGSTAKSVTVTVQSATPAPTVTMSVNPTLVAPNGNSVLDWSTTNATSCSAAGAWSGAKATLGSQSVGPLTMTSTFTLNCTGTGGSGSGSATVTVTAPSTPTVTLNASPTSVAPNSTATMTWSSTNATSCTASGAWSGSKATSGSQSVGPIGATSSFTLSCNGTGGSAESSVTVIVAAPNAPTVDLTAAPSSVSPNGMATLNWSSTDATGCVASGGWSGSKEISGSASVGPLSSTTTYTLTCSGAGGSKDATAVVTVAADSNGADSGGGSLEWLSILALTLLTAARSWRARSTQWVSVRGSHWRTAAAAGAVLVFAMTSSGVAHADANSDWIARSTAPGVVKAVGFDSETEYLKGRYENNPPRDNAWDSAVKASGAGSLRFDIKTNTSEGSGGNWTTNFSDDLSVQFGANQEVWIQWRQRFDPYVIAHHYANTEGNGQWKQVILSAGDRPGVQMSSCSEMELVIQNQGYRRHPSAYTECGAYENFETYLGSDTLGNDMFTDQNMRRNPDGTSNCIYFPTGLDTSGCLKYYPDEWMTFMIHLVMGPVGTAKSSISGSNNKKGFINSTFELYVARQGQPLQLAQRTTNYVVPVGNHWDASKGINPDNPDDPGYTGGWTASDGNPLAKYGKIWLTPYNTQKDSSEVTENASIWYDELIVSSQRIADPSGATAPAGPAVTLTADPTSVALQGSSTLTWTSNSANACTASGGWSGTKALNGSETVGPLAASKTFTLTCTNSAGGSTMKSVSVNVQQSTPPPTVSLSANPVTVTANSSTTLSWTTSNATSCTASGGWSGNKNTIGSESVGPLMATVMYTLTCTGAGGSTAQSVTVTMQQSTPAPTVTLNVSPTSVAPNGTATVTWSSTDATSCVASGGWSGSQATSGSASVGPLSATTNYTLTCTGAGGSKDDTVVVTVDAASSGADSGGGSLGLELLALAALAAARRKALLAHVQIRG